MNVYEFLNSFKQDLDKFESAFINSELNGEDMEEVDLFNTMFNFFSTGNIERVTFEPDPEHFIRMGVFFGYPSCCVAEFVAMAMEGKQPNAGQKLVSEGTGFIPCLEHTDAIVAGTITIAELISNRICKTEFPNDEDEGE